VSKKEKTNEVKVLRVNKRGKTVVITLEGKVEVLLKFPTAKDLNEFIESLI